MSRGVLAARLRQHHVEIEHLAVDDFDAFFDSRRTALLGLIYDAMGKTAAESPAPSLPEDYDLDEEELVDEDTDELVA